MSNQIHPTVIIEGDVKLGTGNQILPYTVLTGPLTLGDNNLIGPHTVIGSPGQDTRNPRYDSSRSPIAIGSHNIIREFTAVQKPCYQDFTRLGDKVYLMQGVHIPHDAILEDEVVVTPLVVVGGITRILRGANLGMGCTIHQYTVVGQYSIVATGAAVVKNVKPFSRYIPGKPTTVNEYAIKKFGYEDVREEIQGYVLRGEKPRSDKLLAVVGHYEKLHTDSKREQYE